MKEKKPWVFTKKRRESNKKAYTVAHEMFKLGREEYNRRHKRK